MPHTWLLHILYSFYVSSNLQDAKFNLSQWLTCFIGQEVTLSEPRELSFINRGRIHILCAFSGAQRRIGGGEYCVEVGAHKQMVNTPYCAIFFCKRTKMCGWEKVWAAAGGIYHLYAQNRLYNFGHVLPIWNFCEKTKKAPENLRLLFVYFWTIYKTCNCKQKLHHILNSIRWTEFFCALCHLYCVCHARYI